MSSTYGGCSPFRLENLESYNRIISIPIVSSGLNIAENVYVQLKKKNSMLTWTLDQAEDTLKAVSTNPAIGLLEAPLSTMDRVICKSLDIVESRIPSINLPPKMIYWNTKEYITDVSTKIVKPVLKRADSVKQMGNTVLTSKYTEYAADKFDDALDVADVYIDKFLPDNEDQKDSKDDEIIVPDKAGKKALHAMQHADRVSRKLQKRLTKRTLEHAKIIKEQSTEAIHVLFYVAEMILTDPKLALQKGKELWTDLSKDEPENQARPKNVEELFVLVVRESARQMVHLLNFSNAKISKLPESISNTTHQTTVVIVEATETIIKSFHLEEVKVILMSAMKCQAQIVNLILQEINSFTSNVLEQARQPEPQQSSPTTVALTVPKVEVTSKAANNRVTANSNHPHGHRDHHSHHGSHYRHHGNHGHKKNGTPPPLHKTEEPEHN